MEYFIVTVILILSLAYVFSPLLRPMKELKSTVNDDRVMQGLIFDKEAVYQQILELDFDHALGNIDDDDYEKSSAELKQQAARIIRKINIGDAKSGKTKGIHCRSCGEQVTNKNKFCPYCGHKLA